MLTSTDRKAKPGDVVVVHGHTTGDHARSGVIVEVLGEPGHEHYLVRWDEEHESLFWPGSDATLSPRRRPARARRSRASAGTADAGQGRKR
jgi:hypothetical protein